MVKQDPPDLEIYFQHRDHIMKSQFDYQEVAMYFDKLVRSHDVHRYVEAGSSGVDYR